MITGVDSMVIAKALCILKEKLSFLGDIHALHIDYANRDESRLEASFVEDWCNRTGLIFNKKIVNEVTRGITDRTEYEKVSRLIRYRFYEENLNLTGCSAVIFGHHKGDVQENVISNVMR
jgi:tRNA(Ile)-lysidine synthase TilS/MesJ